VKGFKKAVDQAGYQESQEALNALPMVDYEAVMEEKLQLARRIFGQEKESFLKDKDVKKFIKDHGHWLKPYALFCTLRDRHGNVDFHTWGQDAVFTEKRLKAATRANSAEFDDIAFYYFLQYQLDQQLLEVATYAREHGIVMKGDIPIGIYRNSVDAWTQPHLYHMDSQSGAPPDPFSDLGQNWGFPTYNWPEMAKDGYSWWQNRLRTLSRYFDAFRIDHILGFFRIWQIPYEQIQGTLGYFNPALPVTLQELQDCGIAFDRDRFCAPFITESIVRELFGDQADTVIDRFLEPAKGDEQLQFKPEFDTQRKVSHALKGSAQEALKKKLFGLHSNVLFIEDPKAPGEAFHPRIDLQKTTSYQHLDGHLQGQLNELYNDYFYHRQEDFWREQAMTKLPAIKAATDMLICGEDLGMIPACVPDVMRELDLLTLEIQRMSKNPKTEFLQAVDIPYFSVCSPSTHDMSPIRFWWEESDRDYISRFYRQELNFGGEPPLTCEPYISEKVILQHLQFPSMWAVFPIQDLLGMDGELRNPIPETERINVPANPEHYWRYRLHLPLEKLVAADGFNVHIQELLSNTGRAL
ncbi:MAG: 4-alpha-glucanotransferase, partial [Lewinella sp.]|nr:4-alpha-glucanotransferase [Lewinella sp.]